MYPVSICIEVHMEVIYLYHSDVRCMLCMVYVCPDGYTRYFANCTCAYTYIRLPRVALSSTASVWVNMYMDVCMSVCLSVCMYCMYICDKNKNCEKCGYSSPPPPSGCQTKQKEASSEMLDDGDSRPPLEPNMLIRALNVSRCRARDLPSQLFHQLCVVGREELDHEAEDGVLGPCRVRERGRREGGKDLNKKCRCFKSRLGSPCYFLMGQIHPEKICLRLICFRVGFSRSSHT